MTARAGTRVSQPLLGAEAGQVGLGEVHHVVALGADVFLGHADVDVGALLEEFGGAAGVVDDEERHDDFAGHVVEAAGQEVVHLLVVGVVDVGHGFLVEVDERSHAVLEGAVGGLGCSMSRITCR